MGFLDGMVYGVQWASPWVIVNYAEEMTIGSLVVGGVISALLALRRRPALAVAVAAIAIFSAAHARPGRVVDPHSYASSDRGRVAVVTGANQGIGKASVQLLAEAGFTVVLCARDPRAGDAAAADVRAAVAGAQIIVARLDLSTLAGVRAFAAALPALVQRVDVLVLNAGLGFAGGSDAVTSDGLSHVLAVNHVAHHLLTRLLLPLLRRAPAPRVVSVASIMACVGAPQPDWHAHLRANHSTSVYDYSDSKLANVLFARAMARHHPDVLSVSLNPGFIMTNLVIKNAVVRAMMQAAGVLALKTAREGAMTTLVAALESWPNGSFLSDGRVQHFPWQATQAQADSLWDATERVLAELQQ